MLKDPSLDKVNFASFGGRSLRPSVPLQEVWQPSLFSVLPGTCAATCGQICVPQKFSKAPSHHFQSCCARIPSLVRPSSSSSSSAFCRTCVLQLCCSRCLVASRGWPQTMLKAPKHSFRCYRATLPSSIFPNSYPSGQGIRPKFLTSDLPLLIKLTQHVDEVLLPVLARFDTREFRM